MRGTATFADRSRSALLLVAKWFACSKTLGHDTCRTSLWSRWSNKLNTRHNGRRQSPRIWVAALTVSPNLVRSVPPKIRPAASTTVDRAHAVAVAVVSQWCDLARNGMSKTIDSNSTTIWNELWCEFACLILARRRNEQLRFRDSAKLAAAVDPSLRSFSTHASVQRRL